RCAVRVRSARSPAGIASATTPATDELERTSDDWQTCRVSRLSRWSVALAVVLFACGRVFTNEPVSNDGGTGGTRGGDPAPAVDGAEPPACYRFTPGKSPCDGGCGDTDLCCLDERRTSYACRASGSCRGDTAYACFGHTCAAYVCCTKGDTATCDNLLC